MKTVMVMTALSIFSLNLSAAESDQFVGICFAYMLQNNIGDGARIVARKTTDLEAAQQYVMSALRSKVSTSDGVAACTVLGIDMRKYRSTPIHTTQKDSSNVER